MTLKEYTELALKTANHDFGGINKRLNSSEEQIMILHGLMGLATESAEALDMMKKHVYYGKEFDRTNLIEEMGDLAWYMALVLDSLDSSFEEAMDLNIKKLQKRYNKGKFTEQDAIERNLEVERKVLENKND